jgi:RimJ/RimL family protein N-acetyltransferase
VDWPAAEPIETARLSLAPLRVEHAGEMVEVLSAPALYEYIGGRPPSHERLRARYTRQAVGHSPDGRERWLNWIARDREAGIAIGTVQATLTNGDGGLTAEIAWVIGAAHQRRGYATEAAAAMVEWLRAKGIDTVTAHIHPGHKASIGVARHLGLTATDIAEHGETRWEGPLAQSDS